MYLTKLKKKVFDLNKDKIISIGISNVSNSVIDYDLCNGGSYREVSVEPYEISEFVSSLTDSLIIWKSSPFDNFPHRSIRILYELICKYIDDLECNVTIRGISQYHSIIVYFGSIESDYSEYNYDTYYDAYGFIYHLSMIPLSDNYYYIYLESPTDKKYFICDQMNGMLTCAFDQILNLL